MRSNNLSELTILLIFHVTVLSYMYWNDGVLLNITRRTEYKVSARGESCVVFNISLIIESTRTLERNYSMYLTCSSHMKGSQKKSLLSLLPLLIKDGGTFILCLSVLTNKPTISRTDEDWRKKEK